VSARTGGSHPSLFAVFEPFFTCEWLVSPSTRR
jgi:hypothetical protein